MARRFVPPRVVPLTRAEIQVGTLMRSHRGPAVVAIGTFDGVHAGHRSLLAQGAAEASRRGVRLVAVTFSPRPDAARAPDSALPDICSLDERVDRLREAGADDVVVLPFTAALRAMSAARFVEHLVHDLGAVALCVGSDFALGRGREGDVPALRALGIEVIAARLVYGRHGEKVASRAIRARLAEGTELRRAA